MTWREDTRTASFRGVPFRTLSADSGGFARRAQTHEYPGRDVPFTEDLGAQTRTFRLEAYVDGDDYFAARDALLEACNREGPGTLVHPTLGTRRVFCTVCGVRESKVDGGMASFDLEFVDAGSNLFPEAVPDTSARVADAAEDTRAESIETFVERFWIEVPQWVRDLDVARIEGASAQVLEAIQQVPDLVGDLESVSRDASVLGSSASALEADPELLGETISGLVRDLADLGDDPGAAIDVLEGLITWGDDFDAIPMTTPSRLLQEQRQTALVRAFRRAAAIEAARRSSEVELASYDEAVALRERVLGFVDAELERAGDIGDDDAYRALTRLYAEVSRDLLERGARLARITSVTLPQSEPVLTIAYRLYGDVGRADEILDRNAVRHPGFVPGAVPLEVLGA